MELMLPKTRNLLGPIQLLSAISLPLIIVVGGGAVLLWYLCLLFAVDPTPIVGGFLHDTVAELSPTLRLLLCVWLSYTLAVYLPIAYFNSVSSLTAAARYAKIKTLSSTRYIFLFKVINVSNIPSLTERFGNLLWRGVPAKAAAKWHASLHPQLS